MNDPLKALLDEALALHKDIDRALGSHRGCQLAIECFARAQASLASDPAALLAAYERATAVVDATLITLPLSDEAETAASEAFAATKEVIVRELLARTER